MNYPTNTNKTCANKDNGDCSIFHDSISWSDLPKIDSTDTLYYPKNSIDKLVVSFNNLNYSNNDYNVTINYWSKVTKGRLCVGYIDNINIEKPIPELFEFNLKSNSDSKSETITFSLSDFLTRFGNNFKLEFQLKCDDDSDGCEENFESSFAASFNTKKLSKFSISNSGEFLKKFQNLLDFQDAKQWKSLANHFNVTTLEFEYDGKTIFNVY